MATNKAATDVGDLGIVIGTAKDWRITLRSKATGAPLPLAASDKLVATVRAGATSAPVLFQRKNAAAGGSDAEIFIVDGPNGVIDLKVVEANSELLVNGQGHAIDLRYELTGDGKDRCAFVGVLKAQTSAGQAIP